MISPCNINWNWPPVTLPLAVEALDGRPLGEGRVLRITEEVKLQIGTLHSEFIQFYVIHSPNHSIILGIPWLRTHNPHISWREGPIVQWGSTCHEHCLSKIPRASSQASSTPVQSMEGLHLPSEYVDLTEAFRKKGASQLPNHRSVDCAIDLMPGAIPPKGRIFPLSQPESEAMKL